MSYTKLRYHLVIGTKDRLPLITPQVEAKLYPILQKEAIEQGGRLFKINGTQDHVHTVAAIHRSVAVEDFINSLKTSSCEALNNSNLNLAWEEHYGALSLYPYEFRNILKYVANQKFHHRKGTIWPEYEKTPYTKLRYHLITGTKYRLPLITPYVETVLYPSWNKIAKDNGNTTSPFRIRFNANAQGKKFRKN
jgi:REP element-mobilizing transposase RayT